MRFSETFTSQFHEDTDFRDEVCSVVGGEFDPSAGSDMIDIVAELVSEGVIDMDDMSDVRKWVILQSEDELSHLVEEASIDFYDGGHSIDLISALAYEVSGTLSVDDITYHGPAMGEYELMETVVESWCEGFNDGKGLDIPWDYLNLEAIYRDETMDAMEVCAGGAWYSVTC